jgi:hypothetical protein
MKTAVEWLENEICNIDEGIQLTKKSAHKILNLFEQAKEMEKEQIVNAFEIGYDNGACVQEGNAIYHGSNYYNETFKSE